MSDRIYSHRELVVYQRSFLAGRRVLEVLNSFLREEMASFTDLIRRCSRGVISGIAEAWSKQRYEPHICSALNVAEAEVAETQVWLDCDAAHEYLGKETASKANEFYSEFLSIIVPMIHDSSSRCDSKSKSDSRSGRLRAGESGSSEVRQQGSDCQIRTETPVIDRTRLLSPSLLHVSSSKSAEVYDA